MQHTIKDHIRESIKTKQDLLETCTDQIQKASRQLIETINSGNKILICGNGGSAADSQHFAAELVNRYKSQRKAIPAIALTTDTSNLTSISNDFNFEIIFQRQIEALGKKGDILIAISTSGKSQNIIKAVKIAKQLGLKTIALTGQNSSELSRISELSIHVPSSKTDRIQESHILILHIFSDLIEKNLKND